MSAILQRPLSSSSTQFRVHYISSFLYTPLVEISFSSHRARQFYSMLSHSFSSSSHTPSPEATTPSYARAPRSFLLYGPTGSGKTRLCKEMADSLRIPLVRICAADLYNRIYAGAEPDVLSLVRRLKERSPCIALLEDADALFPSNELEADRALIASFSKNIFQSLLLSSSSPVVLIATTSSSPSSIYPLIRKQFEEEICVDIPDSTERLSIFKQAIHERLDSEAAGRIDASHLERLNRTRCGGFVAADICSVIDKLAQSLILGHQMTIEDAIDYVRAHSTVAGSVYVQVPEVGFEDIGGLKSLKKRIEEMVVWPLQHPDSFVRLGVTPPRGLLLYGPPGTGKTLIAKAVATATKSNFIACNVPDLIKGEIGESEKVVADLFRRARLSAPCVVFFDEIQAVFGSRGAGGSKLISQLLLEMDSGSDMSSSSPSASASAGGVFVIAATNLPQALDPSLLTPGRFERVVYVPPPDREARKQILFLTLKKMKLVDDAQVLAGMLSTETKGFTGADLKNLCYQAGMETLMRSDAEADTIEWRDFSSALEKVRPSVTREMLQSLEKWSQSFNAVGEADL